MVTLDSRMRTSPSRTNGIRTVRLTVPAGFEGASVELYLIPAEYGGSRARLCVIQAMRCMTGGVFGSEVASWK
jgi:hypothetical protein